MSIRLERCDIPHGYVRVPRFERKVLLFKNLMDARGAV
jgi:hypothetical protein